GGILHENEAPRLQAVGRWREEQRLLERVPVSRRDLASGIELLRGVAPLELLENGFRRDRTSIHSVVIGLGFVLGRTLGEGSGGLHEQAAFIRRERVGDAAHLLGSELRQEELREAGGGSDFERF